MLLLVIYQVLVSTSESPVKISPLVSKINRNESTVNILTLFFFGFLNNAV